MLGRYDFATCALRYCKACKAMVAKVGKPEAFIQTLPIAHLALIAERIESCNWADFEAFAGADGGLFDPAAFCGGIPRNSSAPAARHTFFLPQMRAEPAI